VADWSRRGIASAPVLVPPRRNTVRLLLLIDRQGSMAPFHAFVDEVCGALLGAARLGRVSAYYFHDVPAEGAALELLADLGPGLFPTLDRVLRDVPPLSKGVLYRDPQLLSQVQVAAALRDDAPEASVVVLGDAGAARRRRDTRRLLDAVAFFKAVRTVTARYVWLNPLPPTYWEGNIAAQLARHIPMFPLTREGLDRAVEVLRGQVYSLEMPL
jgi:uncharacterized protein with von Willebrand factor type A (vWA) domain